jgi:hypothetical protein
MAKLTLDQLIRKLEKLPELIGSRRNLDHMARFTRDMIYNRVKSGYGVSADEGEPESIKRRRLKSLADSYREYRKGEAYYFTRGGKVVRVPARSYNLGRHGLGRYFSPGRSNLTMTGQMLEAMAYTVGGTGYRVFIRDSSRRDGKLTNAQVAEHVSRDRPFMAIHQGELLILQEELINLTRAAIRQSGL